MAARLRTLPAAVAPVLVGTSLALGARALPPARVRRRAARRDVHPGRDEPLQRLLRRAPRRRHRGPARPRARDRRRARAAAPGAAGDLRHVRPRRRRAASTWSPSPAGSCSLVGAASILAGVLYTGGPRPYGYEGLGEVFVFLFFGIVAVAGSYFVQVSGCRGRRSCCAVPVGLLASAILVVNNVRDLETDRRAGKRTLAVRLGRARTPSAVHGDGRRARSSRRRCRGRSAR